MDEQQDKYSVILDLATKKFNEKLNQTEKQLGKLEKPRRVKILTDAERVPAEFQKIFNNYNKLAMKMSKIRLTDRLFGDERKSTTYAKFFNDIRSDAVNAIEQMNNEMPEIMLKMSERQKELDDTNIMKADYEKQLKNAEKRANKWKLQMEASVNFNPQEIQAELDKASANLRKAELDKMALPDWKKDEKTVKQTEIDKYKQQIDDLTNKLNNPPDMSKYEKNFDRAAKKIEYCKQQLLQLNALIETQTTEQNSDNDRFTAIAKEYEAILNDMEQNPLDVKLESKTLKRYSKRGLEMKEAFHGVNQEINKLNAKSRMTHKIFTRMTSQIAYWLNPLNIFIRAFSKWQEQNKEVKNTFEVISYNLVRVVAPLMQTVANAFLKISQYANIFTKAWFNIDLFDKTAKKAAETKKNVDSVTASFDELHDISKDSDKDNDKTLADTGELPPINPQWEEALTKWANGAGKKVGEVLGWAMEHPILATLGAIFGTKLIGWLGGKLIKGAGKLIGKGIAKLFGGSEAIDGAKSGGSLLGSLFGKQLYAGMNGKAVTVGKLLGGVALAAGGTALAIGQAADAGAHWQDLSTGAKAAKVATVGLGSAAAGLGAVMLGASGPVGWAVAGAVALGSFVVGMAQTQDGIDSVKKETEKLAEAQNNAAVAQQNYEAAVSNAATTMSNLERIEQQTGLSGKALAEQVDSGKLSVDNMTSAQLQVYSAYLQNKKAIEELKAATEQKKEADKQAVIQSLRTEAANAIEAKSYDDLREKVVKAWKEGSISAEEAGDILSRTLANADDETQRTFGNSIPAEIKEAFNPDQYESGLRKFGNNFKNAMNDIGKWFEDKWNGLKNWWNSLWNKNDIPDGSGFSDGGRRRFRRRRSAERGQ